MKAWFYEQYGGPEVLKQGELAVPEVKTGQVLVKIKAAALNPVDFKIRQGYLKSMVDLGFPTVPGCDVAGVVAEVGAGVTKFKVGDEVYSDVQNFTKKENMRSVGTLTEFTAVEEELVAHKPSNLTFEEAAALPLALLTALDAFKTADFKEGQSVFITGGAGGVGSMAVQLARHVLNAGLVVSTASPPKAEFVKSLGAHEVLDYTSLSYAELANKFDLLFDCVGIPESYVVAKENGRIMEIAVVAKENGRIMEIAAHYEDPRSRWIMVNPNGGELEKLKPFIESGKIKPAIEPHSPFSFDDVPQAFKLLESNRAKGKIVISPISSQ